MPEHRQHPRAPIELEIAYQRMNSFFVDYTRNVSKGGMFVRTSRPPPVGTRFLFRLEIPGQAERLQLTGEVVHITPEGDEAGMGLRFVWSGDAEREAFEAAVEHLMTESLGPRAAGELLRKPGSGEHGSGE
jgi:type IV pilus assembly protein PilZ